MCSSVSKYSSFSSFFCAKKNTFRLISFFFLCITVQKQLQWRKKNLVQFGKKAVQFCQVNSEKRDKRNCWLEAILRYNFVAAEAVSGSCFGYYAWLVNKRKFQKKRFLFLVLLSVIPNRNLLFVPTNHLVEKL